MITADQRAIGCDHLGLKGASRYDDRESMVKTWHDLDPKRPVDEQVPSDEVLLTAAIEAEQIASAVRTAAETERTTVKGGREQLEADETRLRAGGVTVAVLGAIVLRMLVAMKWMLKRSGAWD
jgi:hypothetical protein